MTTLQALRVAHDTLRDRNINPSLGPDEELIEASEVLCDLLDKIGQTAVDVTIKPVHKTGPKGTPTYCGKCGVQCPSARAALKHCNRKGNK